MPLTSLLVVVERIILFRKTFQFLYFPEENKKFIREIIDKSNRSLISLAIRFCNIGRR